VIVCQIGVGLWFCAQYETGGLAGVGRAGPGRGMAAAVVAAGLGLFCDRGFLTSVNAADCEGLLTTVCINCFDVNLVCVGSVDLVDRGLLTAVNDNSCRCRLL
jgi:hypothetical protein